MYNLNEIYDYVYKEFKIKLDAYKSAQMTRRIETFINKLNVDTSRDFIDLCKRDSGIKEEFLDLITINVTEFFRNQEIFFRLIDMFKNHLPKRDIYRIWSAACSNGSEPYSVAMILEEMEIENYTIFATDIDKKILAYAEDGVYKKDEIEQVPKDYLNSYFDKVGDKFKIKDFIRDKIIFRKHDLILNQYPYGVDLILCRNVVIYFNKEEKMKIYNRFYECLNDYGIVFIGATENIYDYQQIGFSRLGTFFYQKVVK